ncbi:cytochrome c maturation protein CcmE [Methylovirgula sp. 4M-Z18]|uniref:cytochrome c maturation protein CcmE n=1 Tax=Methylovirgula sp. 4M-Z18 TaxID=2293567 RepID=UPI000E2F77DD|nr:cytochrome c maturation protein CcmE [Methylovirgula sp. 4M-Z18]RFB76317.1 cytochrome c maturation protein CcmE [Methylovirgula sp. 4M-Z18]
MTRKGRRLFVIALAGGMLALAAGLVLFALRDTIVFFYGPSEVIAKNLPAGTRLRIGGLVKEGSVQKPEAMVTDFVITDRNHDVHVVYHGLLPDLFREGQGVVAEGVLDGSASIAADSVLAKHDERYMPREVVDALKKQGRWQEGSSDAPSQ